MKGKKKAENPAVILCIELIIVGMKFKIALYTIVHVELFSPHKMWNFVRDGGTLLCANAFYIVVPLELMIVRTVAGIIKE